MQIRSPAVGQALQAFAARAAAALPAPNRAQSGPPSHAEVRAADDAWRSEVSREASEARALPMFDAQEARKSQARAKLQQVRDWLKIVRKLYAQNPEGMARALAQAVKDLKAAVKAYRDAGGEEMAMAGAATGAALATGPAPTRATTPEDKPAAAAPAADAEDAEQSDEPETTQGAGEDADGLAGDDETPADRQIGFADIVAGAYAAGRSLFDAVAGEVRKQIGEDGLNFLKEVRALVKDMADLLLTARGQAAIRRKDKSTDKAFEAADQAFRELNQAMDDMERDLRHDAPTAGMRLSAAA